MFYKRVVGISQRRESEAFHVINFCNFKITKVYRLSAGRPRQSATHHEVVYSCALASQGLFFVF